MPPLISRRHPSPLPSLRTDWAHHSVCIRKRLPYLVGFTFFFFLIQPYTHFGTNLLRCMIRNNFVCMYVLLTNIEHWHAETVAVIQFVRSVWTVFGEFWTYFWTNLLCTVKTWVLTVTGDCSRTMWTVSMFCLLICVNTYNPNIRIQCSYSKVCTGLNVSFHNGFFIKTVYILGLYVEDSMRRDVKWFVWKCLCIDVFLFY